MERTRNERALIVQRNVLLIVLFALGTWLIVSRVNLFEARRALHECHTQVRAKQRHAELADVLGRLDRVDWVTSAVPQRDPQAHLAAVRRRFADIVRGRQADTPVADPAPVAVASAVPTPGPDATPDPGPVLTPRHQGIDRDNADRMERLQAWVRTHLREWHGVTI